MEAWIEELFSKELLYKAAEAFHTDATNAKKLGDFENYVFEVYRDEVPFILRLTHSSHRTKEEIEGELEWINFLHAGGVDVSLAHTSGTNDLVETFKVADSKFFACLFTKAPGQLVTHKEPAFNEALFQAWGKAIGKMHAVTRLYEPTVRKRGNWYENTEKQVTSFITLESDQEIKDKALQLVTEMKQLPQRNDTYQLIHTDLHNHNFFYHEGKVYAFDFDDASYHYLISDLAIAVYYATWRATEGLGIKERSAYGNDMFAHLLKGYVSENKLSYEVLEWIPAFFRLRDVELYSVFIQKIDLSKADERIKRLVGDIRDRILREELLVELDIEKYKDLLES
ncbi:phosphotransferase enzyme family protein [Mangrovibacillus cuniculi]|uniref:Phosphotransferase n=1 Tax=Mangrovibacillus cuniculi TaxID=2593652 RepID=A0A7S8CDR1_9BACI|nr:phosphotransferase [Mangrovibacillus cuniculi]QPC48119.1 phosphotransferase [Mangrovibacillus cuniculi]